MFDELENEIDIRASMKLDELSNRD